MKNVLARLFTRAEDGQGLMEYALILSLAVVICVAALTTLGQQIVAALLEPAAAMFQ